MSDFYAIQSQTGWGRVQARFAEWCRPEPGWRTLDVGCGPGLLPSLFARQGCRAFGLDLEEAAFRPRRLHRQVVVADLRELPFPNSTFDLITASNVLFLLADPVDALRWLKGLLLPGGHLAVLNPSERMSVEAAGSLAEQHNLQGVARDSLINWARNAEANHRWGQGGLAALFDAAGFQLLESETIMGSGLARLGRGRVR